MGPRIWTHNSTDVLMLFQQSYTTHIRYICNNSHATEQTQSLPPKKTEEAVAEKGVKASLQKIVPLRLAK